MSYQLAIGRARMDERVMQAEVPTRESSIGRSARAAEGPRQTSQVPRYVRYGFEVSR